MTTGEKQVARLLCKLLEDDYLIWFDVPLGRQRRYPDFIILHPLRGLLFLEVKDWKADTIRGMTPTTCTLLTANGLKQEAHPLEQARQVAYQVVNDLLRNPQLRQTDERYRGKLVCPYGWGVVFTNIRREQVTNKTPEETRERLLPDHLVLYKDDLSDSVDPEVFQQRLWRMFNVSFPCKLHLPQIDCIRWHLFPELRIGNSGQASLFAAEEQGEPQSIKQELPEIMRIMDIQQEQLARSLGEGHRVIHGVAGSGKTLILGYRCLHLAQALSKPILVLCFNIALAAKLRSFIEARGIHQRVQVYHFHDWCGLQCKTYNVDVRPGAGQYFDRLVESVIAGVDRGQIPRGQYGALLIDEGHDFEAEWLRLVTQVVDPETNSLLLLYDDAQSIYKKRSALSFSLASVGIQAQGRTTILRLNYRNSREILEFAYHLAKDYLQGGGKEDIPLVEPQAAGSTGPQPVVRSSEGLAGEIAYVVRCLQKWHAQGMPWKEMAILYPGGAAGERMAEALARVAIPSAHLKTAEIKKRYCAEEDVVPILTIHSSKGLEFSTVVVLDASFMPSKGEVTLGEAMRLLYVGITRARERLLVSFHRDNELGQALVADR